MKDDRVLMGFVAYFAVFGGIGMALVGYDSLEFGVICKILLLLECLLGMIILLIGLAQIAPNKKAQSHKRSYRVSYRDADMFRVERDNRCRGYITAEEIRRAAKRGR